MSEQALLHVAGEPILGHLRMFRRDRVGMMLALAGAHPEIVEVSMGLVRRLVVVSAPALANEVLVQRNASFAKAPGLTIFLRPVLGDGLLTSEHRTHEKQRKLLAPAFAHKRIAGYATAMADRAQRFTAGWREGQHVDVAEEMMKLTFEIVGKTLFDAEVGADADVVGNAVEVAMNQAVSQLGSPIPLPPFVPTPGNLRYRRAVGQLDEIVYRMIRERRRQGGDRGDVLSMLLAAKDEAGEGMTDREVRDESMTLFLAGHETTANGLAWTFYLLARHPEIRARLEAELDALGHVPTYDDLKQLPYTIAVFKEAMRLYPPVYIIARRAIEDTVVGGRKIGKNAIVIVNVVGLHKRADVFPDPERFDPERFLGDRERQLPRGAYIPFSVGPRNCIGNHFALMEAHLLLATIAQRVRFDLQRKEPAELEQLVTLRPKNGLPARVTLR